MLLRSRVHWVSHVEQPPAFEKRRCSLINGAEDDSSVPIPGNFSDRLAINVASAESGNDEARDWIMSGDCADQGARRSALCRGRLVVSHGALAVVLI